MRTASKMLVAVLLAWTTGAVFAAAKQASVAEQGALEYPPSARRAGEEGTVTISVEVRADGSVGETSVATSSGSTRLDQAGLEAVRTWRYTAASDEAGKAIKSYMAVPVTFRLTESDKSETAMQRERMPDTEAGRLGQIWTYYWAYKTVNEEYFQRCQALGVETAEARAANQKFNTEADAKVPVLEEKLKQALIANGRQDPEAFQRDERQKLEVRVKIGMAEQFAKNDPAKNKSVCAETMAFLKHVEGSFRFTDYYERLMAL